MAKAFTEEEKRMIKEKIMETALELFHDKGTKSISIGELTRRVGIAQGSFYNFWADKESLVIDLMAFRSMQKLNALEMEFGASINDPILFLTDVICRYSMDLVEKSRNRPVYREAFQIFAGKGKSDEERFSRLYGDFLKKLVRFWKEHSVVSDVDERGLENVFIGSFILCSRNEHFNEKYFKEVLRAFVEAVAGKYIEVQK